MPWCISIVTVIHAGGLQSYLANLFD